MESSYGRVILPNQNMRTETFLSRESSIRFPTNARPLRTVRMDSIAMSTPNLSPAPNTPHMNQLRLEPRVYTIQSVVEKNKKSAIDFATRSARRVENF